MSPSGAPVPMIRLVQELPPLNDTPSKSPLTTPGSGRVDIVTMFDGSVGLMAIASSASLPWVALASKLVGVGAAATGPPDQPIHAVIRDEATTSVTILARTVPLLLPQCKSSDCSDRTGIVFVGAVGS